MQERERTRAERKVALAESQLVGLEDMVSEHELNLVRLESIPESDREDDWRLAADSERTAAETLSRAIDATLAEVDKIRKLLEEG